MFTRCVFCHVTLPANELVERFPHGRRIAFDPERGRLWVVCPACSRWNLAPIEERWEALEELERTARDRGRLLSQTDNIALIRAGEIELVRVGKATRLPEEAWWRYGRELQKRRSRHTLVSILETSAMVGLSLTMGGFYWYYGGSFANNFLRWREYGSTAWRGYLQCPRCGSLIEELKFNQAKRIVVLPEADGVVLALRCRNCAYVDTSGQLRLEGNTAQHVLRRVLAWQNYAGASDAQVREATHAIETAGSAEMFTRGIVSTPLTLDELRKKQNRTRAIGLEIALNDDAERRLLELELSELEARWREEEELASIVDNELTPVPALEKLRRMLR